MSGPQAGVPLSWAEEVRLARELLRDAGTVKAEAVRTSFVQAMTVIGHPVATCPKSWRHRFAGFGAVVISGPEGRQTLRDPY